MIITINGNMLEQHNEIKDESVDLLLTDPPYNISENGAKPVWIDRKTGKDKNSVHNQRFSESFSENWDSVSHEVFLIQMEEWSNFWFSKIRKGGSFAIFISDRYISYLWKIMEKSGFEPKRMWTWKKPAAVPFNRSINPVSGCEYILWGIKPKGKRTFNSDIEKNTIIDRFAVADKMSSILYKLIQENIHNRTIDDIFEDAKSKSKEMLLDRKSENNIIEAVIPNTITYSGGLGKKKIHPTEKPVEVLKYFVALLSNKGDLVLDTFAGSGSTGIACQSLDRNCILIERDNKMFKLMKNRIDKLDPDLFGV